MVRTLPADRRKLCSTSCSACLGLRVSAIPPAPNPSTHARPSITNMPATRSPTAGSTNLMQWACLVPGKAGTEWEDGLFPVRLVFDEDYPNSPPQC